MPKRHDAEALLNSLPCPIPNPSPKEAYGWSSGQADHAADALSAREAEYQAFLATKDHSAKSSGFDFPQESLHPSLFDWQKDIVHWGLRRGKAALFEDCGLGKTFQQLEWGRAVSQHSKGGQVLLLCPLAVAEQTLAEYEMWIEKLPKRKRAAFCCPVRIVRNQSQCGPGINIANYEMLHHFDAAQFVGIILDESSILKAFDGKTRDTIIAFAQSIPYRLCCTATPSPNDYMELGNHAEFLGIMTYAEMLAVFFTHDGGDTSKWRLKGHAEKRFWEWLATWAIAIRRPSDLGYSDDGFILPELRVHHHVVDSPVTDGYLFPCPAGDLSERRQARRDSLAERVKLCYKLIDDQRTASKEGIQPPLPSGACQEVTTTSVGLVLHQSGHDRQGSQENVHEKICREAPGEVPSDSGATRQVQRPEAKGLRHRSGRTRQSETRRDGLDSQESGNEEGAEVETVWPDNRNISSSDGQTREEVCGVQLLGHDGPQHVPIDRSLPQDKPRSGVTVRAMQQGDRIDAGQPGSAASGRRVPGVQWVVWCHLNLEQDTLADAIGANCVSVQGRDSTEEKISREKQWRSGDVPVLVTKPACLGWGMNWQHCNHVIFAGISDSFESYYQAVRRCWRFGQTRPVHVHLVYSESEKPVAENIERKERQAAEMMESLVAHMREAMIREVRGASAEVMEYDPQVEMVMPDWVKVGV